MNTKNEMEPTSIPAEWVYAKDTWKGMGFCICCNKLTQEKGPHVRLARLDEDEMIMPPFQVAAEEDDRSFFPIGYGCLKKYPGLKAYACRL
jgi:hypothetical protein